MLSAAHMRRCLFFMNELYIARTSVWTEEGPDDSQALAELKAELPRKAARRMTRLGMQMSHVLKDLSIGETSSVVYATTYSESCMIEKYLDSFPYPSPQGFQTSIHPSGVEQYLIPSKKPVLEFFPLAGEAGLMLRALDTVNLCSGEALVLCGGEERGTWLLEQGLSSEENYAWAMELSREKNADSIGVVRWSGFRNIQASELKIPAVVDAIQGRRSLEFSEDGATYFELNWSGIS